MDFEIDALSEFRLWRSISGRGEITYLDFFPNRFFFRLGTAQKAETEKGRIQNTEYRIQPALGTIPTSEG
jgi:hypothetical protein